MATLLITLWLFILGHQYSEKKPKEKILLKRSSGWESYAILARLGVIALFNTTVLAFGYLLFIVITFKFIDVMLTHYLNLGMPDDLLKNSLLQLWDIELFNIPHAAVIAILTLLSTSQPELVKTDLRKALYKIKSIDSYLYIILTAMEEQTAIKISLKSKKVYVGVVYSECSGQLIQQSLIS